MANRDAPHGFRPAKGIGVTHQYMEFIVTTSNGTNMFVGDIIDFDGTSVTPAAADAGVSVIGVCTELKDTNGVSIGHPNSAVSTKYLPASTAGQVIVALAIPGAVFVCQSDSDGSSDPAATDVGATADHVAGTGDTTTSTSRHELDASDITTGLQLRIIGIVNDPNNAYGEHVDLYVTFNESALSGAGGASV